MIKINVADIEYYSFFEIYERFSYDVRYTIECFIINIFYFPKYWSIDYD
jgi:hypothetical protein